MHRRDVLGPFGIPFAPIIDEIAVTSVTDISLGPETRVSHQRACSYRRETRTYSHVGAVFFMKFPVADMVLSIYHNPCIPELRHSCPEWPWIFIERVEGRDAVNEDG